MARLQAGSLARLRNFSAGVSWLDNRIRRSKKVDVSIGVDLITALMKAARIVEIVDTDQTRHENSP